MQKFFLMGILFIASVLITACDKKTNQVESVKPTTLAKINGEVITSADVDFMIERLMQNQDLTLVDETLKQKVLDSLIASRSMKQAVFAQMSEQEKAAMEKSVKAYEEELYVKEYLQKNAVPAPVTAEMIQQYYDSHQNEFGSEAIKDLEILTTTTKLDDKQRDSLLAAVAELKKTANWSAQEKRLQQQYQLDFQQARTKSGLLNPDLEKVVASLKQGDTSDAFFSEGNFYLVRVINVVSEAVKPLSEVSNDIRKRLAAQQLREAVKKASEEAKQKAKIELM
jgi:parvulin-like peptidyl-prolyl isomerase